MDKFERGITYIQVGITWWCWKISLIPLAREYWKAKHNQHRKELKNDKK